MQTAVEEAFLAHLLSHELADFWEQAGAIDFTSHSARVNLCPTLG